MKLLKRAVSAMLALAVLVTSFAVGELSSVTASADTVHIWDGTADTSWYTGDKEVYEIYTAEQLAGLSKLVTDVAHEDRFSGITFNLMNDICLNDTSNFENWFDQPPKNKWDPMGRNGSWFSKSYDAFAGVFNGNGHTISGMYVYQNKIDSGLFGYISAAVISNLKMEKCFTMMDDPYLSGASGILAGRCESSVIDNVEINDCSAYGSVFTGGLVGDTCGTRSTMLIGFNLALALSTGIVFNPILFSGVDLDLGQSAITNCKVSNTSIKSYMREYNPMLITCCAPIAGCANKGTYFLNCISENCVAGCKKYRPYDFRYGAIFANSGNHSIAGESTKAGNNFTIKNCYAYNFQYVGKPGNSNCAVKHVFTDAAAAVDKDEYYSAEFVKKLGENYKSAPNGAPVLKSIKNSELNYLAYPGDVDNNGKFDLSDITAALKLFINDKTVDQRTLEAIGAAAKGRIELSDITRLLKDYVNS